MKLQNAGSPDVERHEDHFLGRFTAMASPCEVLVDTDDANLAGVVLEQARTEALRIEHKFSRYRNDNLVHAINHAGGRTVMVDDETALLLDYAATCHELSGGTFDITSGALRRVWTFDGREQIPDRDAIADALRHVGWNRVTWHDHALTLPAGMEVDFGGIGKEYAVDRAAAAIAACTDVAFLVNFGGDLSATGPRRGGRPWIVGVEDPARVGETGAARIELVRGAVATSGDARRFVTVAGKRLGHILDPHTGWPVEHAPRSVTVMAGTCVEAGSLATLAILRGREAEQFLADQGVEFWSVR